MSRVICGLKISSTPLPSLPLSSTVATPGAFLPFDTKPIKQGPEPQDEERVDVHPQTAGLYLYADKACGNRLMTHQFLYKRREFITLLAGAADGGRAPTL